MRYARRLGWESTTRGQLELFRRVLEASKRVQGPDDPNTLMNANNLANLLNDQGKYAESAQLFERTYKAQEQVLGKNHPDTLLSLGNLASVHKSLGHYKEAETLFKRGLEASERVLGRNHESSPQAGLGAPRFSRSFLSLL